MAQNSTAAALIAEHEEIDIGTAQFVARVGELGTEPGAVEKHFQT